VVKIWRSNIVPTLVMYVFRQGGNMDPHGHVGVNVYSEVTYRPNWQNISAADADMVCRNLMQPTWWGIPEHLGFIMDELKQVSRPPCWDLANADGLLLREYCRICCPTNSGDLCIISVCLRYQPEYVSGAENGAERAEIRLERSEVVSGLNLPLKIRSTVKPPM